MAWTIKRKGKTIHMGRTRNAFATKREAIFVKNYVKKFAPKIKGMRIVKVR